MGGSSVATAKKPNFLIFNPSFLDIMSADADGFFVPTLDIDLAWHTHQMMTNHYFKDCRTYVGRYIDQ